MPLEMQMMHQRVTGGEGLAVVVVLFNTEPNAYGELLDAVIGKRLPSKPWQEAVRKPPLEFGPVLAGSPFYTYEGSLTVPPCEQKVKYFVRKEAVPAAPAQLNEFKKVLQETCEPKGNYRIPQSLTGQVALVGSVDVVGGQGKLVKPAKPKLETEEVSSDEEVQALHLCGSEFFDNAQQNVDRVATDEPDFLIHAKTHYNTMIRDYQAAQGSALDSKRNLDTVQRLYDNTPGPVEKIEVMWKLHTAKQLAVAAQKAVPEKAKRAKEAYKEIVAAFSRQCLEMSAKTAEQAVLSTTPKPKKEKATRQLTYPKPNIKLPHGLGGSPFSQIEPDTAKVIVPAKIAVNLAQPEVPSSAITEDAAGEDSSAQKSLGDPDKILSMQLPITQAGMGDASAFSTNLKKALADTAHVDVTRLEVKEIKKSGINKVHKTTAAISPTLAQSHAKGQPRKRLRQTFFL
jgi:hypothetical protein